MFLSTVFGRNKSIALPDQRNMPGNIECQRGETVRGAVLRVERTGVGRVAEAGTVLTVSFSWAALACTTTRLFGQTVGSSPLVLALEKAGPAISNSTNK